MYCHRKIKMNDIFSDFLLMMVVVARKNRSKSVYHENTLFRIQKRKI